MCGENSGTTKNLGENVEACLTPPKLVRGLTSTPVDNNAALAALVHQAMANHPSWAALSADDLDVKDVSGAGGAKTFKIFPRSDDTKLDPPAVALHSVPAGSGHGFVKKSETSNQLYMRRMSAGSQAIAACGASPARLAEGSDWYVEAWAAEGQPACSTPEMWSKVGHLLAKVHKVPVDWFEPYRAEIVAEEPCAKGVSANSPAWIFFARCVKFPDSTLGDQATFAEWAEMGHIAPQHPAGQQIVTCHGDLHPGNMIEYEDGKLEVVDFEFTTVTTSILDLAFGVACTGGVDKHRRAFIASYLEGMGYPAEDVAIDQLLVDAYLAMLYLWHSGGELAAFCVHEKEAAEIMDLVQRCKLFAQDVRASPELQQKLLARRLERTKGEHSAFSITSQLLKSSWYQSIQKALDEEEALPGDAVDAAVDAAGSFMLKPSGDNSKALQVRPGTARVELQDADGSANQLWVAVGHAADSIWTGVQLQHVKTGLCLDTEVKYCHFTLGKPWETGSELFVRACDSHSARQRWTVDHFNGGLIIRHSIDGRVLDVNFGQLDAGRGVNVCAAYGMMESQSWVREFTETVVEADPMSKAEHFIGFRASGGAYQCWLVENSKGEQFVQHNYPNGIYAAFRLDGEDPVDRGSWKMQDGVYSESCPAYGALQGDAENFYMDVDVPEHGPHKYTATSDIYLRGCRSELDKLPVEEFRRRRARQTSHTERGAPWKQPPSKPILDLPEGAEFLIQPGACLDTCLAVRSDGYTKDPHEVFLQKVNPGSVAQRWRLVGSDTFQHVESGRFLHSETKYAFVINVNQPWEANHTNLVTRPQDFSDQQRWVVGPEEFHGGQVLRHYMDGRGVDVHCWQVSRDGNNMGCENAVHSDRTGNSYVFTLQI